VLKYQMIQKSFVLMRKSAKFIEILQIGYTIVTFSFSKTDRWKSFFFDRVWGANSRQVDVFADVEPMILTVVGTSNTVRIIF